VFCNDMTPDINEDPFGFTPEPATPPLAKESTPRIILPPISELTNMGSDVHMRMHFENTPTSGCDYNKFLNEKFTPEDLDMEEEIKKRDENASIFEQSGYEEGLSDGTIMEQLPPLSTLYQQPSNL
jgi:hypothetical protein